MPLRPMIESRNIAIIGGGLTGLVAALRLAEAGYQVTVFESGSVLGGLAASFDIGGEPLEKAYHHLFRTDTEILSLISELGLSDRLEWRESSVAIYREKKIWPFMTPVDLLRFAPASFIGRIRLGLTALRIKHMKRWENLRSVPALDWMRTHCGSSATRAVWEPLLRGKFSNYAGEVSMAWLWARLHIRSNSREPGGGKEKLGYIRGGFVEIINALENRLKKLNVELRKNSAIDSIQSGENGSVLVATQGTIHRYHACVFTGSNRALGALLPRTPDLDVYRENLGKIKYLGAICLVFETDQKLGEHYWININEEDSPFIVFIRHTRLIPAERYNGREVYYLGAYVRQDGRRFSLDQPTLEKEWFTYLKQLFPEFEPSRIGSKHLFRFRDAQHVVTSTYTEDIPSRNTPLENLMLANFTQIFPEDRGTNYAVREGIKVAKDLLNK